jgi:hypothetical protein
MANLPKREQKREGLTRVAQSIVKHEPITGMYQSTYADISTDQDLTEYYGITSDSTSKGHLTPTNPLFVKIK